MSGEQWVMLWSHSQQAVHIETVADMLRANALAFGEGRAMDYAPLWIGARKECDAFALHVKAQRDRLAA